MQSIVAHWMPLPTPPNEDAKLDYQEKVAWLRRYQDSLRREHELAQEVEQLRTEAIHITPLLTGAPGGSASCDKVPLCIERIMETQQKLFEQIDTGIDLRSEITDAISCVPDVRLQNLLRYRYILCRSWEDISERMELSNKWVRHLHELAIQLFLS